MSPTPLTKFEMAQHMVVKLQDEITNLEIMNAYMSSRRMGSGSKELVAGISKIINDNATDIEEKKKFQSFLERTYHLDQLDQTHNVPGALTKEDGKLWDIWCKLKSLAFWRGED